MSAYPLVSSYLHYNKNLNYLHTDIHNNLQVKPIMKNNAAIQPVKFNVEIIKKNSLMSVPIMLAKVNQQIDRSSTAPVNPIMLTIKTVEKPTTIKNTLTTFQKASSINNTLSIDELIETHGHFVMKFIKKRCWDIQSADDIFQSTMLEALKCFNKFRGESHPRTWLCGIAYNMVRNHAKSFNTPSFESLDNLHNNEYLTDNTIFGTENPFNIHLRDAQLDHLCTIFDTLPNDMKITFDEVVSNGRTYEETAKKLNLPIGTVRSRISRARDIFRMQSNYS